MALSLNSLKINQGGLKKRKRIGRGNASGTGTYAGKGQKGQKARAGVSQLKRLGMKKQLLMIPKSRGFKSLQPKNQPVNFTDLNKYFKDGDVITPTALFEKGLVKNITTPIKILAKGKLTLKGLKLEGLKMSETVKKQIS